MSGEIVTVATSGFGQELYSDVKTWIAGLAKWLKVASRKANAERFASPAELLDGLKRNVVQDGSMVTLECKPSGFAPFLRTAPVVFFDNFGRRRGPSVGTGDPLRDMLLGMGQRLRPVGLYPALDETVAQACLYPSDAVAFGFDLSPISGLDPSTEVVQYIPALVARRHVPYFNVPCHVHGTVRVLSQSTFADVGFASERYEELRQAGAVWFLDATGDDSSCVPLGDSVAGEVWGGLYASGHIELGEGYVDSNDAAEIIASALRLDGRDVKILQNQVDPKTYFIAGDGIRAGLNQFNASYDIHMDAELGISYAASRALFDTACNTVLHGLKDLCAARSVELFNPLDLDFTYTNSTKAFTVLRSRAADAVQDPMLVAIRDWHRRRCER